MASEQFVPCIVTHCSLLFRIGSLFSQVMTPQEKEPAFLTIYWQTGNLKKETVQATLCLAHRRQVALEHPKARGCGKLGDSCDLCEGREPRAMDGLGAGGFSVP